MTTSARPKARMSVQTKLLGPVLVCLLVVPVVTVVIVARQISSQLLTEGHQSLARTENIFRQAIDRRLSDLASRVRAALEEPQYRGIAAVAASEASEQRNNTIQLFFSNRPGQTSGSPIHGFGDDCDAIMFSYADPEIKPVGSTRGAIGSLVDFGDATKSLVEGAVAGETVQRAMSIGSSVQYVVSVPVVAAETGQIVGALTAAQAISERELSDLSKLSRADIVLAREGRSLMSSFTEVDGASLTHLIGESDGTAAPPNPLELLVNGQPLRFLVAAGDYGERRTEGPGSGFRYLLLYSFEPTLVALQDTERNLAGLAGLGVLTSGLIVWYSTRRAIRPLQQLRNAAEIVGRGDFSKRQKVYANDEFGDLAEAFNQMVANLADSRLELEKVFESLKATQEQLIQSEKLSAVGQFVSGVAHELNNPLTAVIGYSELLVLSEEGSEDTREQLQLVAKSAQRCHKIVQNLLSFARQHPPERRLTQINGVIDEVLDIMTYDFRTGNVTVVREYAQALPAITADPHQLQQVFVNILGNARQALEGFRSDSCIVVRTKATGAMVRIEIGDNGPGIRAENLSRIFDPFFTTKPIGKGTGLGMSLSYGIVREHGGSIRVESVFGHGATFVIELPLATQGVSAEPRLDLAPRPRAVGRTGKNVLVVDDEEILLDLTRRLVSAEGHEVETARGGEEAISALSRQRFDVILLDWKMPGMNGLRLYEHLRSRDPTAASRVLFMTGDSNNETLQEFLRRYDRTCLPKPFRIAEFQVAVAQLIRN
jgi:signal transduction histidine kinase